MHAAESVHNLIDKAARLADGQPIKVIRATLGELTGLTPDQVLAEFERCRIDTPAEGAELALRWEPGLAVCLACEQRVPVHADGQGCRACGSYRRRVVAGQMLTVEGVSVDRSRAATKKAAASRRTTGQSALARRHT